MFDPVRPVPINTALSVSLNNYYDILKNQIGGLQEEEYLQLKLVADPIDVSATDYPWFSYYGLLNRADLAIDPVPLSGVITVNSARLSDTYGDFLRLLRNHAVEAELSHDEKLQVHAYDSDEEGLKKTITQYQLQDRQVWNQYAPIMGYQLGDVTAYTQWLTNNGHLSQIQQAYQQVQIIQFKRQTILNKQFPESSDKQVVDAESTFNSPSMKLDCPVYPDTAYLPTKLDLNYLTHLSLTANGQSTAQFDNRLALAWNLALTTLQSSGAGSFDATMNHQTDDSSSISTDWGASASVGSGFLSANVSASDSKQIQQDFNNVSSIAVSAKAAMKVQIGYPEWFKPNLFSHKRVLETPQAFVQYFGKNGSLLYYPTSLIVVRGFKVVFTSQQNWTYDYHDKFSASGEGGFNAFGISFGSSDSYTNEEKHHHVDVAGTALTIADDPSTIRFVGYAVHKNTALINHVMADKRDKLKPLFAQEEADEAERPQQSEKRTSRNPAKKKTQTDA